MGVEPDVLAARDQMRDGKLQQLAAVVEERDKVLVEMSRLFIIEVKFRAGSNFRIEEARRKLEASFANEAEIVFTTVSSSGRKIFSSLAHGFDMVVIDEAAQASEVAVLPPLSLRAARCVLVGDPQQLPATVISRAADTMQYSRSLFERFQQAGCPAILLSVQYRMHPRIRDFPSRYFYQGRLVDSESVQALPDEIYHKDSLLQPYLFFDVSHGRESHGGSVSYQNKMEAQVAIHLFEHLHKVLAEAAAAAAGNVPPAKVSVGIITPYKQQLTCLEKEFLTVVGSNAASKGVYINTVDAFQGQERDVIIMSCVRASSHGVGFVADIRRMNVALTRARRSLWVIGNASALVQSEDWAALLADAKDRGCFVSSATCITRGLLPEPPMASTGILHQPPRSGPPLLSRGGRGMAPSSPMGGPHFLPGRHPLGTPPRTPGEEHWSSRRHGQDPVAFLERGDSEGQDLWQRSGQGRSCRGQREGAHPGFGPTFQHPGRRSKDL
jgi:senataxin